MFLLASAVTELPTRNCGGPFFLRRSQQTARSCRDIIGHVLGSAGGPPPAPRAFTPKMALRAQLPVPAVRGWRSRFEAAAMRVSALRHRVAGAVKFDPFLTNVGLELVSYQIGANTLRFMAADVNAAVPN